MNREDAKKEIAELQGIFPIPPHEGDEAVRAEETGRRLHELWAYVFCDGPAPADGWKPSVPSPTGEARLEIIRKRAQITIAELDAADAALRRAEEGRSDQGPRP